jgi:hypothetical protein
MVRYSRSYLESTGTKLPFPKYHLKRNQRSEAMSRVRTRWESVVSLTATVASVPERILGFRRRGEMVWRWW